MPTIIPLSTGHAHVAANVFHCDNCGERIWGRKERCPHCGRKLDPIAMAGWRLASEMQERRILGEWR